MSEVDPKNPTPDSVMGGMDLSALVQTVTREDLLADSVPAIIQAAGAKALLQCIAAKDIVAHVPLQALVDAAGWKNIVKHLRVEYRVGELDMSDARVLDRVLCDPSALSKLLTDDRALRAGRRAIGGAEAAGRLTYATPVPLVSFPRAGSNFLQSVLQVSSGLRSQSIYQPLDAHVRTTLTVKSHAPSQAYLLDEWRRFYPEAAPPVKLVLLVRDPRDQLISFLEYSRNRRQIEIEGADFLDRADYFLASNIDRNAERSVFQGGLTIAEAFRTFTDSWVRTPPQGTEILQLRYEDLLTQPHVAFQRLFDFLSLDCALADDALQHKVSLYGDTGGRERGVIRGWEKHYARYAPLVDQIHAKLGAEMTALGYDAAARAATQDEHSPL